MTRSELISKGSAQNRLAKEWPRKARLGICVEQIGKGKDWPGTERLRNGKEGHQEDGNGGITDQRVNNPAPVRLKVGGRG